jgi:hypothetical protein
MKLIAVLFVLLLASTGWADTYRWVDEKGTEHFTNDRGSIPEKYRDQVKERQDEPSTKPKKDEKPQKTLKPVKTLKKETGKESQKSAGKDHRSEPKTGRSKVESDAADAFQAIVSHWKDGNFEAVYQYGTHKSRAGIAKENFVQKMGKKSWGLASSWETIRNIEAEFKSSTVVYITAKIGYKQRQGGDVRALTESFEMKLENGLWRTDLSKILQAPSGGRKEARR